jgi:hypothetical protein
VTFEASFITSCFKNSSTRAKADVNFRNSYAWIIEVEASSIDFIDFVGFVGFVGFDSSCFKTAGSLINQTKYVCFSFK